MTVDGTTPTGVSDPQDEGQRQPSPREQMMARIEGQLEEQRRDQIHVPLDPGSAETTDGGAQLVDDPQRFRVRVKVGDREEEKTLDSVLHELATANGRVRAVSKRERELEARERALAEREQQISAQTATPSATDDDADVDGRIQAAMAALVEGDEEMAASALKSLLKGRREPATPVIDSAAVAAQVKEQLASEQVWDDFVRENPDFREEFDAEGNPVLSEKRQFGDFIYMRDYASRVASGEISYREALKETAAAVGKAFSPPPAPAPPAPSGREQREQRKAAIDNLPVAAGARAAGPAAEPDETNASIIAQMRKARGLRA